jgi:broad specificity phosphatase PhoE
MRLYILRHEDRPNDCSFFTPLTKKGKENAIKLITKLKKQNINLIISSPFIRTLATIHPYSIEKNIKINIEYSLSEIHLQDLIPKKAVGITLPEDIAIEYNYNPEYKTFLQHDNIVYPEKYDDVKKRMTNFLKHLFINYLKTDYNIVLVTHQSLCRVVLEILNNNIQKYKNKINKTLIDNYDKGKLCMIFNYDWDFKEL